MTISRTRKSHDERSNDILTAAVKLAKRKGWVSLTRDSVADAAGVSPSLISARFGTMSALKDAVMRDAVDNEVLTVLATGLLHRNSIALKAPGSLKARAIKSIIS